MAETVYEIMMRLGLEHTGAMAGLTAIASNLKNIHGLSENVGASFIKWGPMIAVAAGAAGIGLMVAGIETILKKAEGLSDELVKLKLLGSDMAQAVDSGMASKLAFDIARRVPLPVEDIAKGLGTGFSIFGKEATPELVEDVAKAQWVLQFNSGFRGGSAKDMQDLMRAGEQSGRLTDATTGKIDPTKVRAWLDLAQRIISGSHGLVTAQSLLGLTQQGGFALRGLSEKGFMGEAIMAQVMSGQRAGTATLGVMQQFSKGTMTGPTAQGMEDAGLLKPGEWHMEKMRVVIDEAARSRLTAKFANDPMDIAADVIANLNEKGITDPTERLRRVLGAFGRQTTQRYSAEQVMNFEQQIAERDRWLKGAGVAKANEAIMSGSLTANLVAFQHAWDNLLAALGGPLIKPAISALGGLADTLRALAQYTALHPGMMNSLAIGFDLLGKALWALTAPLRAVIDLISLGAAGLKFLDHFHLLGGMQDWLGNKMEHYFDQPKSLMPIVPQKQSFEGSSPDFHEMIRHTSFNPSSNIQPVVVKMTTDMNIDGRMLAQAVSEVLEDLYMHPTGPPQANGFDHFRPQGNFSDT